MLIDVTKHALMITSFVLMMMLLIEYINVQTRGEWQKSLKKSRFGQYFLAAFLGVVPGCLGAFTVVSLYSHRMVSFGALVAAMIATSGDLDPYLQLLGPDRAEVAANDDAVEIPSLELEAVDDELGPLVLGFHLGHPLPDGDGAAAVIQRTAATSAGSTARAVPDFQRQRNTTSTTASPSARKALLRT